MTTAQLFKKAWKKHRRLPRLYAESTLRVTPEHQFIRELHISLASWNRKELDQFIDDMGYEPIAGILNKTFAAREITDEVFEAWTDDIEIFCNLDTIYEVLQTK